ncbi:MAG: GPW/gp25 family protein [Betaproteobacteria bacterium]|nr:GPW/gp25 family protein [Betaproteobacteria bacterium]
MDMDRSFLGSGWGFPPEFDKNTKSVRMVSGEEDIVESLLILMATAPGERVMQPAYGCGLKLLVFENITESILTAIKDTIQRAVLFFEPRINLENIEINEERAYEGVLLIKLVYTVRTTNSRSNLVYPFYFQEGTNIPT